MGHTEVVRILLERGADPTITDEDGLTALMHAQEEGHEDIVALLVQQQIGSTIQRNSDTERPRRQRPAVTGEREITPSGPTLVVTDSAAVDELPRLLASPPLQYPDSLREVGIEGVVVLEFVIDTTGHAAPSSITVVESPHTAFSDIAKDVVLVSVYSPGRKDGVPVAVRVRESLTFRNQR
jgi:outer membrane biosynthesis protein TonB